MSSAEEIEDEFGDDAVDACAIESSTIENATEIVRKRLDKVMKSPDVEGSITIQLVQKVKMGEMPVDRFRLGFGEDSGEKAREIIDAAVEDALKNPAGKVGYAIRIMGFDQATRFELRRVGGGGEGGFSAESPFLPNQAGFNEATVSLLSHLMKHNDGYAKQIGVAGRREADILMTLLKEERDKNLFLERSRFDVIRQAEEVISMGWARRREEKKIEADERRTEELISMAKAVGPGLAAHLKLLPPHVAQMMQQAIIAADAAKESSGDPGSGGPSDESASASGGPSDRTNGRTDHGPTDQRTTDDLHAWAADFRLVQAALMAMPVEVLNGLFGNLRPEHQAALQRMAERAERQGQKQS